MWQTSHLHSSSDSTEQLLTKTIAAVQGNLPVVNLAICKLLPETYQIANCEHHLPAVQVLVATQHV